MDPIVIEQARYIYDTIRILQVRVLPRHCAPFPNGPERIELTLPQINTLYAVRDRGQVTIKELAEALGVSAPSASSMVDRLVEMGLVSREQSKEDRREVVVQVTAVGQDAVARTEEVFLRSIAEVVERVGPEWAERWCALYHRIREVLGVDAETGTEGRSDP